MNKWKRRITTGVLRWRGPSKFEGLFANPPKSGHIGWLQIDYLYDTDRLTNRRFFPQINLTALEAESYTP